MAGSIIAWQISKYMGAHLVKVTGLLRRKVNTLKDGRRGDSLRGGMVCTPQMGKGKSSDAKVSSEAQAEYHADSSSFLLLVPIAHCHCIVLGNWVVSAWWLRMPRPSLRRWSCCFLPVQLWTSHLNSWESIIVFSKWKWSIFSSAFSKI